jgi:hypothetical protein
MLACLTASSKAYTVAQAKRMLDIDSVAHGCFKTMGSTLKEAGL